MSFSKNTKKTGWVLAKSTVGYLIAKKLNKKDNYLYIVVGGFIGTRIAEELLSENIKKLKSEKL